MDDAADREESGHMTAVGLRAWSITPFPRFAPVLAAGPLDRWTAGALEHARA